jgi:hypothetical protein
VTTRGHPDDLFSARKRNAIPFNFVLEELAGVDPWTRPMCGCAEVSMGERIAFILRDKKDRADGEMGATMKEHRLPLRANCRTSA